MHWERLISQKKVKLYLLPMFPVIFLWISFIFFNFYLNFNVLVIIGLLWCLFIEIFLLKLLNIGILK